MPEDITFINREPDVRMLYDMKTVVYDRDWLNQAENTPLYYMYRDLYREGDRKTILENSLRFDITVLPPKMMGDEYVKTKGHFHPISQSMTFPELYGVLDGKAHYLLQKKGREPEQVVLIKASEGDFVLIPPGYGHVTVNPTSEKLRMANWVFRDFKSIYKPIEKRGGAAWFELKNGFKKNTNYGDVPEIEVFEADEFDLFGGFKHIYDIIEEPNRLELLHSPEENNWIFKKLDFFRP